MLRVGDTAPDFIAETTEGAIRFHEWIGDGWAILFSHPKDFTPVCTTELGYMAALAGEFAKRNCKIVGLSVDPVAAHQKWKAEIEETVRTVLLIAPDRKINATIAYPMTTGRNFNEVLRVLDSLQRMAKHNVATPVNWEPGDDVIIPPSVSDADAKVKYPQSWKTLKPYLRVVAQPQ